jgi:hypothetical protein
VVDIDAGGLDLVAEEYDQSVQADVQVSLRQSHERVFDCE